MCGQPMQRGRSSCHISFPDCPSFVFRRSRGGEDVWAPPEVGDLYMRGSLVLKRIKILLLIGCAVAGLPALARAAESQGRTTGTATNIRLGTPVASLSYLPIHVALKKGFFAKRGFDVEVIQMAAGLVPRHFSTGRSITRRYPAGPLPPALGDCP